MSWHPIRLGQYAGIKETVSKELERMKDLQEDNLKSIEVFGHWLQLVRLEGFLGY